VPNKANWRAGSNRGQRAMRLMTPNKVNLRGSSKEMEDVLCKTKPILRPAGWHARPTVPNKANWQGLLGGSRGASVRNKANSSCRTDGGHSPPYEALPSVRNKANLGRKTRAGRPRHERLTASLRAGAILRNKANSGAGALGLRIGDCGLRIERRESASARLQRQASAAVRNKANLHWHPAGAWRPAMGWMG